MSFAATGWCEKIILSIAIIYTCGGKTIPTLAEEINQEQINFNYNYLQVSYPQEYSSSPEQKYSCQEIDSIYREIYSFQTDNYHISICQLEDSFYYYRQSKLENTSNTLVPAQLVFGGNVFKAVEGKTIYFVGKDENRYYSSVMLNNNEIVLEPEILPTPVSFSRDIVDSGVSFTFGNVTLSSLHQTTNVSSPHRFLQSEQNGIGHLVCIRDSSVLNPRFDDWQNLLGKSPDIANKYATNNGHNFVYDDLSPDRAVIKTKDGKIVNLNIAATGAVIEQVCVQPTKDI